jgi:hypothetical protein
MIPAFLQFSQFPVMIHGRNQIPIIKKHEPNNKTHAAEQVFVFEPGRDVGEKLQNCEFLVFSLWFIVL